MSNISANTLLHTPLDNADNEFATLLAQNPIQNPKVGELIQAEVVSMDKDFVRVSTGLKSDSFIALSIFQSQRLPYVFPHGSTEEVDTDYYAQNLDIQIGDTIECVLDSVDDGMGNTQVSYPKSQHQKAWVLLAQAMQDQSHIAGYVANTIKGGLEVQLGCVKAFLPGSLVDVTSVSDNSFLKNQMIRCKVIKMDSVRNNVVVSRRAVYEDETGQSRDELLQKLRGGEVLEGLVKNITDYGAFIGLGGIDGLLHITDMAWNRISHPSEVLKISDKVQVKVLSFDEENNRVSLGMKQLEEDPLEKVTKSLSEGDEFVGKITSVVDYGCFVEIQDGIDGLVHSSEIDWVQRNPNPRRMFKVGDEIKVRVIGVDSEKRRISLSKKRCETNPWELFGQTHKKGDVVKGKVCSITDFGLFLALEAGIDALVHINDLSYTDTNEEVLKSYQKDQEVEAVVLQIRPEDSRISLGIKQLNPDPFMTFVQNHPKGCEVSGKVLAVDDRYISVELADDITARLNTKELEGGVNSIKEGDSIEALVANVDEKNRKISLSQKALKASQERSAVAQYQQKAKEEQSSATIGDLLKEQLKNTREEKSQEEQSSASKEATQESDEKK